MDENNEYDLIDWLLEKTIAVILWIMAALAVVMLLTNI